MWIRSRFLSPYIHDYGDINDDPSSFVSRRSIMNDDDDNDDDDDDDDKGAVACRWVINVTVELIQIMMYDE
jgi:hypothetical protein